MEKMSPENYRLTQYSNLLNIVKVVPNQTEQ